MIPTGAVVVADTSPLLHLLLIHELHLLPAIFHEILIPPAVRVEMMHDGSPEALRHLAHQLHSWLSVRSPSTRLPLNFDLDRGESEAIALAKELDAFQLLTDDGAARRAAIQVGLEVAGTLGILLKAAQQQLCDINVALDKLMNTNFLCNRRLTQRSAKTRFH